jgi:hypothetical protein
MFIGFTLTVVVKCRASCFFEQAVLVSTGKSGSAINWPLFWKHFESISAGVRLSSVIINAGESAPGLGKSGHKKNRCPRRSSGFSKDRVKA